MQEIDAYAKACGTAKIPCSDIRRFPAQNSATGCISHCFYEEIGRVEGRAVVEFSKNSLRAGNCDPRAVRRGLRPPPMPSPIIGSNPLVRCGRGARPREGSFAGNRPGGRSQIGSPLRFRQLLHQSSVRTYLFVAGAPARGFLRRQSAVGAIADRFTPPAPPASQPDFQRLSISENRRDLSEGYVVGAGGLPPQRAPKPRSAQPPHGVFSDALFPSSPFLNVTNILPSSAADETLRWSVSSDERPERERGGRSS